MPTVIEGKELMLYVETGTGSSKVFKPVAYSTSHSIEFTNEVRERVTKSAANGKWKEKFVASCGCSITCESLVSYDSEVGYKELLGIMKAGTPVLLRFGMKTTGAGVKFEEGSFVIESLSQTAGAAEDATMSVTFSNSGEVATKEGAITTIVA